VAQFAVAMAPLWRSSENCASFWRGSRAAVFELNEGSHHVHLICTVCGKVEEFVDRDIERGQDEIAKERGFAHYEHSLSLYDVYGDCKSAKTARSGKALSRGDKHERQEIRHHPVAFQDERSYSPWRPSSSEVLRFSRLLFV
jgi:hypothetical protein